ncbi:hypothetical protein AAFC00_001018 [Neodothiora populina]|uniref:Man(5)GlcNAc(2)-PP-dolichol translocation protein RFT1 n=1 Tax=Neodothiora populina TaxID=2781224 RepID=A0ABR3PMI5_9PEZI
MSDSAISASAKGASFLILLQIGSRALTFALNQILLRFLSPELLGVSVQLELYCISVLYFSRESLRVTLQRRADGVQAVVNLAYLALAAGVPISYLLAELYLRTELPNVAHLILSLQIYGVAALVELCSEPSFVAGQQKMLYKVRASAEAAATIMKTFVTVGLVFWAASGAGGEKKDLGVLPFAAGQLAYAVCLLLVYIGRMAVVARSEGFSLLPRRIVSTTEKFWLSLFSNPLLNLTLSLTIQSSIKYVLTQGDSLLIASLASLQDQGAYALSSNYGGLIARMLFQPIEEASRNLFAKLCAPASTPAPTTTSITTEGKQAAATQETAASKANIQRAAQTLHQILTLYTLLSLIITTLGPSLSHPLLTLIAGSKWTSTGASSVLALYANYIPLLAINGVTEAFVAATATRGELYRQSIWMGVFSAVFAGSAFLFLRVLEWGAKGLVVANCVGMACRIVFNLGFVKAFFKRNGETFSIQSILPTFYTIASTGLAMALVNTTALPTSTASKKGIFTPLALFLSRYGVLGELVRIGAVGVVYVIALAFFERKFLLGFYRQMRPTR